MKLACKDIRVKIEFYLMTNQYTNYNLSLPVMKAISISDFTYVLPPERIALYPLPERDKSRLLVYRQGEVEHNVFESLATHLPANAILFFNDTRVIPARLHFTKDTGAAIEIFLLGPLTPSTLFTEAMLARGVSTWQCTIGNLKRWHDGAVLKKHINGSLLEARLRDREKGIVEFTWNEAQSFAEMIHGSGETPLPPYIKRKAEASDRERYQTVYAHYDGAVAAPTAGLHFTPHVLESLKSKGIQTDFLTLHVSAGTFQPVKTSNAAEHIMHNEQVIISRKNMESLLQKDKFIVPVGTTSMRTLESLYWFGAKLMADADAAFRITQNDPYIFRGEPPPLKDALKRVLTYMNEHQLEVLTGETSIYIVPGYTFRLCNALITNFHQPGSTLILLVAAFVGPDWKKIYDEALKNDYRFLSYGDSSLLMC